MEGGGMVDDEEVDVEVEVGDLGRFGVGNRRGGR